MSFKSGFESSDKNFRNGFHSSVSIFTFNSSPLQQPNVGLIRAISSYSQCNSRWQLVSSKWSSWCNWP